MREIRADRQPDFTQIDLELTFPKQETIFRVVEGFLRAAFATANITLPEGNFIQMTYDQAIRKYGIDKPDMRLPAMVDLSAEVTPELRESLKIDPTLPILGFTIPSVGELSGTARKALLAEVRTSFGETGLDLLDVARLRTAQAFAPLAEAITTALTNELAAFTNNPQITTNNSADLHIVVTPKPGTPSMWNYDPQWIYKRVGQLRLDLAKKYADKHKLFDQTGTQVPLAAGGRRVIVFAGIGNPNGFLYTVRSMGMEVSAACWFDDHHEYDPKSDFGRLLKLTNDRPVEAWVTTLKDFVKLRDAALPRPVWYVRIESRLRGHELELLRARLREVVGRPMPV